MKKSLVQFEKNFNNYNHRKKEFHMFKSFGLGFILGAGVGLAAAFLPTDDEKRCLKDDVKDYVDGTVNDSTTFSNNLTTFQDNLNNFSQQTPIATETLSSLQNRTEKFQNIVNKKTDELKDKISNLNEKLISLNADLKERN